MKRKKVASGKGKEEAEKGKRQERGRRQEARKGKEVENNLGLVSGVTMVQYLLHIYHFHHFQDYSIHLKLCLLRPTAPFLLLTSLISWQ